MKQYESLRQKVRDKASNLGSSSWSAASADLEKAYSQVTSTGTSTFDRFYERWGGLIRSGEAPSHKWLEDNARLALSNDDDNLRFAKAFQHTMNQYRMETTLKRI